METHESNSKTPGTENPGHGKISGTSGNDLADDKMDLNRQQDELLSPILAVSQRFMSNLRKGLRGKSSVAKGKSIDKEGDQNPAPRRLRDWDTRLFVLSTLKRMVDREHFEEMDEEENRTPLTREALQNRKQLMEGRDQRQRRRKKDEKLIPTSRLTNKITDESTLLNTRDKQHIEKSRNVQEQGRKVKAGTALSDALQKVVAIKNPHPVSEMPEVKQNNEVIEPKNEVTEHFGEIEEQHNELKEQNRTKRGFFNFNGKK